MKEKSVSEQCGEIYKYGSLFLIVFTILFIILTVFLMFLRPNKRKCSNAELNIVIDQVQLCKKKNAICPEKEIDRLIKEICVK